MKTLLIVDLQNDFCPGGALATHHGDMVVPVINRIMKGFDLVIASKDWHPPDSIHFTKWPPHCVRDTKGAEFHPDLDSSRIKFVFLKGTGDKDDGYSAFEATNKNLKTYLDERQVTRLYVAGLTTEYCVKETTIDAVNQGFETYVIRDAVEGVKAKEGDEEKAYKMMEQAGVKVINSFEL